MQNKSVQMTSCTGKQSLSNRLGLRIAVLRLACLWAMWSSTVSADEKSTADIPGGRWMAANEWFSKHGFMDMSSEGFFQPEDLVSISLFAVLLIVVVVIAFMISSHSKRLAEGLNNITNIPEILPQTLQEVSDAEEAVMDISLSSDLPLMQNHVDLVQIQIKQNPQYAALVLKRWLSESSVDLNVSERRS